MKFSMLTGILRDGLWRIGALQQYLESLGLRNSMPSRARVSRCRHADWLKNHMRDCGVAVVLIHYIYRGSMVAMPVAMWVRRGR
jgi:hypothetical protein